MKELNVDENYFVEKLIELKVEIESMKNEFEKIIKGIEEKKMKIESIRDICVKNVEKHF